MRILGHLADEKKEKYNTEEEGYRVRECFDQGYKNRLCSCRKFDMKKSLVV